MSDLSEPPPSSSEGQPADAAGSAWLSTFKAAATRRALLLTALGGLLIAGLITVVPVGSDTTGLAAYLSPEKSAAGGPDGAFRDAAAGACLTWPDKNPDAAGIVDCKDEHRFEVAQAVDMSTFPGSEYGPDAAPPSQARIQQISAEQCQAAVQRYLGPEFDPNSRFTVSMLWSGDKAWKQSGERRMLCGLQLPGPDNQQLVFIGKVAELDQSKVWPPGTCLGIDPTSNQPTDVPVDCASPHAMEVTGSVNLAEKFPGGFPAEADQDAYIKDACTRLTEAFLAPLQLRSTTLTLIYSTVSLPSWTAGSRQVACSIGATLGNGGWATLLNSAKGALLINGQPPVPPPDIPAERLTLPPEPAAGTAQYPSGEPSYSGSSGNSSSGYTGSSSGSNSGSSSSADDTSQQTQHMPAPPPAAPAPAPPPQGNVFNPPPPGAPPADVPPPAAPAPPAPPAPPGDVPPPPAPGLPPGPPGPPPAG